MISNNKSETKGEKKNSVYGLDAEIVNLQNNMLKYKRFDSSSKLIQIRGNDTTNLFCVSVDGSDHSDRAFEIVTEEFYNVGSKLLAMHVSNPDQDHEYNYKNKKETVMNFYAGKVAKIGGGANFVVEDRKEGLSHAVEQVMAFAMFFKANFLVSGYYGIKGPKGDNNELSKGVSYMLGYSTIPCIIIKDTLLRSKKSDIRHTWLVVLDRQFPNATKCFQTFSQLIDPITDLVSGLTIDTMDSSSSSDDFKDLFMKEIEDRGIVNYTYERKFSSKSPSAIVCDKVNDGDVEYDFVIFMNNRNKHRTDGANSDVINIVKNCSSSVCFYNF
jgi:hypothetical protein